MAPNENRGSWVLAIPACGNCQPYSIFETTSEI